VKIKTVEGHLTPKDKAAIKAMYNMGLTKAKVGRRAYSITSTGDLHEVVITLTDRGLSPCAGSPLRQSVYRHKFKMETSQ
jgi:hypothetical protein